MKSRKLNYLNTVTEQYNDLKSAIKMLPIKQSLKVLGFNPEFFQTFK